MTNYRIQGATGEGEVVIGLEVRAQVVDAPLEEVQLALQDAVDDLVDRALALVDGSSYSCSLNGDPIA